MPRSPDRLYPAPKNGAGFTLIELLIVIAILAILIIISMMSWRLQIDKANDAKKKDDLHRISLAFEEYFNDAECYPAADILVNCGGSELDPYLDKVPCDPITKLPYCYITDEDNPGCFQNFRVLTPLKYKDDPVIVNIGCNGEQFCGYEEICAVPEQNVEGFNYGVASTNITVANPVMPSPSPLPSPSPSGSPLPSPSPGQYACDPTGTCNVYDNPTGHGCPLTFANPATCQQYCNASPTYWCDS